MADLAKVEPARLHRGLRVMRLALIAALLLTLAACDARPDMRVRTVRLQADYPVYDTLADLYARAGVVAAVTLAPSTEVRGPEEDLPAAYTIYIGRIDRLYKGTVTGDLALKQIGGKHDGTEYVEVGTPRLQPGARYLVFVEVYSDSPASLLNPTQGQYKIGEGDALTPVDPAGLRFTLADVLRLAG